MKRHVRAFLKEFVFGLALVCASAAMAAGSSSSSRPRTPAPAQPSAYELGVQAVQSRDYARALSLMQKVVDSDPRNADAWNYLGFSQRNLRRFDAALAAYQKALAIDPGHRGANEYLGELYLQTGNLAKAQGRLEKLGSLCPSGCKELDDLKKAVRAFEAAHRKG